jgi:hypothetical protein
MSDDEFPRPQLTFHPDVEYYESTDFARVFADVSNDGWIGTGDAMIDVALLHEGGMAQQVHLPIQVDNGPVTRGARVFLAIENVSGGHRGETQISLIGSSGAEIGGSDEWRVSHLPIREPDWGN